MIRQDVAAYLCATEGCRVRVSEPHMHCCTYCWSTSRTGHGPTCGWWDQAETDQL